MHPKVGLGLAVATILLVGCAPRSYGAPSEERQLSSIQEPHIILGEDIDIKDAPYQISIELLTLHTCGGAIVSENWIITAAHCVDSRISGVTWLKRIRAGSTTSIPIIGWGGKTYGIAEAIFHPKFDIRTIDYDVGVIRVNSKIEFGSLVQKIVVPDASEDSFIDYKDSATSTGWGLTDRNAFWTSFYLKRVTIPLIARKTCIELQKDQPIQISPRMLCAGGTGKGGPCHGDSGGPFVYKNQVIGLVSWGIRCNDDKLPSVFTNVLDPEIRGYIKEHTGV